MAAMACRTTTVRRFAATALALAALSGSGAFTDSAPASATMTLARGAADRAVTRIASSAPASPGRGPYVLLRHDGLISSLLDGLL